MQNSVSRRFLLGGLAALSAAPVAWAGAPDRSIRPQLRLPGLRKRVIGGPERLVAASGLSGDVAFAVADVQTGLRLEGYNDTRGQPPASVTKAVTALYALDALGADHRFVTRLIAAGTVSAGVLQGDLILAGGGDPTLDTDDLADMAIGLREAGIREVRGAFRVYDGLLPQVQTIDAGQPDHVGYSPAVSGIALNFNRVHFEWKRGSTGYAVTMDARTGKYRPEVAMARMGVANRDLPVYTYADREGVDYWTVARGALGNGGARWLPVRRPAEYAGDVFRTMARANGITLERARVSRSLPAGGSVLVQHRSDALGKILKDMLKYSNNLTAEMVGMMSTRQRGRSPLSLKGSAQEMSRWASDSLGMRNASLVDHSGLGDASRMSPAELVTALVQVRKRGLLRPILKPLALRDANGAIMRDHPIKVDAKTGTLNFVSGLGGFMTAADGTELAFAIFAADTSIRSKIKRADRERPPGARTWNRRAKTLQQKLIERWGALYGS